MYRSAQIFQERFNKVGSLSTLMDRAGNNAQLLGDSKKENYGDDWHLTTGKIRNELNNLLQDIKNQRKGSRVHQEIQDLYRLEQQIISYLKAMKRMTPKHKMTFSQCFMHVAESSLNEGVFQDIRNKAQTMYHAAQNIDGFKQ